MYASNCCDGSENMNNTISCAHYPFTPVYLRENSYDSLLTNHMNTKRMNLQRDVADKPLSCFMPFDYDTIPMNLFDSVGPNMSCDISEMREGLEYIGSLSTTYSSQFEENCDNVSENDRVQWPSTQEIKNHTSMRRLSISESLSKPKTPKRSSKTNDRKHATKRKRQAPKQFSRPFAKRPKWSKSFSSLEKLDKVVLKASGKKVISGRPSKVVSNILGTKRKRHAPKQFSKPVAKKPKWSKSFSSLEKLDKVVIKANGKKVISEKPSKVVPNIRGTKRKRSEFKILSKSSMHTRPLAKRRRHAKSLSSNECEQLLPNVSRKSHATKRNRSALKLHSKASVKARPLAKRRKIYESLSSKKSAPIPKTATVNSGQKCNKLASDPSLNETKVIMKKKVSKQKRKTKSAKSTTRINKKMLKATKLQKMAKAMYPHDVITKPELEKPKSTQELRKQNARRANPASKRKSGCKEASMNTARETKLLNKKDYKRKVARKRIREYKAPKSSLAKSKTKSKSSVYYDAMSETPSEYFDAPNDPISLKPTHRNVTKKSNDTKAKKLKKFKFVTKHSRKQLSNKYIKDDSKDLSTKFENESIEPQENEKPKTQNKNVQHTSKTELAEDNGKSQDNKKAKSMEETNEELDSSKIGKYCNKTGQNVPVDYRRASCEIAQRTKLIDNKPDKITLKFPLSKKRLNKAKI